MFESNAQRFSYPCTILREFNMVKLFSRPNRRVFTLLTGLSVLLGMTRVAAQTPSWPSRRIRLVVSFPPGGLADALSRIIQQPLGDALGQSIIIENRGGASGNIAGAEVVRNGGDHHTFLVTVSTIESVNPLIFNPMPFDPQRDLQPVALLANTRLFLITRHTLPPNSLREFLDYARTPGNLLRYGSPGNGTTPHLAGELLMRSAGFSATHIPYRGAAPMIQDVMAGHIDFAFAPGTVFPTVRAGNLKMFAVASRVRDPIAPDIPTLSEKGVRDVYADTLFAIYAPQGVPPDVIARLNREINRILAQQSIKTRFMELAAEALPLGVHELKGMVQTETRLFTDIIRSRGITAGS